MPRKEPANAELVVVSREDAELLDFFSTRRTFNEDGSIRYVQLIGDPALLEAAGRNENLSAALPGSSKKKTQVSLPRLIAQRMIGRPLESSEVVLQKNNKRGDVRRSNLEVSTRSELSSGERASWSSTGAKYVYRATQSDKYYAQINNVSLGTYNSVEEAALAVEEFKTMVGSGISEDEAQIRVMNRSRNRGRVVVID